MNGIVWRYELKTTEIYRSGFWLMGCFSYQRYGHTAKICRATAKCGHCAEDYGTRECKKSSEVRCCNCGRKHEALNHSYTARIAAKAKMIQNRTHDLEKYQIQQAHLKYPTGWQIANSKKRRVENTATQLMGKNGTVTWVRRLGKPKKNSNPSSLFWVEPIFRVVSNSQFLEGL